AAVLACGLGQNRAVACIAASGCGWAVGSRAGYAVSRVMTAGIDAVVLPQRLASPVVEAAGAGPVTTGLTESEDCPGKLSASIGSELSAGVVRLAARAQRTCTSTAECGIAVVVIPGSRSASRLRLQRTAAGRGAACTTRSTGDLSTVTRV